VRAEFFGGPLDGDTVDFVGIVPEEITVPTNSGTNRYTETLAAHRTPWVHVYRSDDVATRGVFRLEYQGYREETAPAGA
jgi:hypothetical protein